MVTNDNAKVDLVGVHSKRIVGPLDPVRHAASCSDVHDRHPKPGRCTQHVERNVLRRRRRAVRLYEPRRRPGRLGKQDAVRGKRGADSLKDGWHGTGERAVARDRNAVVGVKRHG